MKNHENNPISYAEADSLISDIRTLKDYEAVRNLLIEEAGVTSENDPIEVQSKYNPARNISVLGLLKGDLSKNEDTENANEEVIVNEVDSIEPEELEDSEENTNKTFDTVNP